MNFDDLGFEDFKKMADDGSLSNEEKIGFTKGYRIGSETLIIRELLLNTSFGNRKQTVLDLGCGCGVLVHRIIQESTQRDHFLYLVDSDEVLAKLSHPECTFPVSHGGKFPVPITMSFDLIIVYSVLQHVVNDDGINGVKEFIDAAVNLLSINGILFLGDIPRLYKGDYVANSFMHEEFLFKLLRKYRNDNYKSYIIPHIKGHPLYETRDNILIRRLR